MASHPVQPPVLQVVDRRLDGRMLPAGGAEFDSACALALGLAKAPLLRQGAVLQQFVQAAAVARRMESLVEAAGAKIRNPPLRFLDYIEGFYNTRRVHSALGYQSPNAYAKALANGPRKRSR